MRRLDGLSGFERRLTPLQERDRQYWEEKRKKKVKKEKTENRGGSTCKPGLGPSVSQDIGVLTLALGMICSHGLERLRLQMKI